MTDKPKQTRTPTTVEDTGTPAGHALKEGDRLGNRYLLQRRIGTGGMSVVWRAWDEALQRSVAVKVMHAPLTTCLGDREMIRREARAAARIEHPNAMGVYDVGETITSGGRLTAYVVMRLLDGHSLADLLDDGPLIWQDAVEIVVRVADVLAAAHGHGIVHRDVTPENVMLTDEGAKLLDFGIAARVGEREDEVPGPVFGTPPYVAPERLHGAEAAGATDVYALGVLMFQMLTGRMPYPETTWDELETAHRAGRPPKPTGVPGLPRSVARLCRRCLATDPSDRPTAAEIASTLNDALYAETHRFQRTVRRLVAVMVSCLVIAATAIIATGPSLTPGGGTKPDPTVQEPQVSNGPGVIAAAPSQSPSSSKTPTPKRSTSSAPSVLSVLQATAAVHALIDQGAKDTSIRADVASDISQQVDNLVDYPAQTPEERQRQLNDVRKHIRDRVREQGMTQSIASDLDSALVTLGAAIERELSNRSSGTSVPA
ncbi:MAG: serine/threonine protein kinase [Micromonosporaceae bacterium]|nr:serine/threonine protein kinase [Micromonosporaceae bacterium]